MILNLILLFVKSVFNWKIVLGEGFVKTMTGLGSSLLPPGNDGDGEGGHGLEFIGDDTGDKSNPCARDLGVRLEELDASDKLSINSGTRINRVSIRD